MKEGAIGDDLGAERLTASLLERGCSLPAPPAVLAEVDSTNSWVSAQLAAGAAAPLACLAEAQSAGRGRRGRSWVSPAGCNIYLSLGLRVPGPVAELPAFALVVAAVLAGQLERIGVPQVGVKWPNDVLVGERKLAGILCEASHGVHGVALVAGIGINVRMPPTVARTLERPWTSIDAELTEVPPRAELAAGLIAGVITAFDTFTGVGLAPFLDEIRARDCLAGLPVSYPSSSGRATGTALGIDATGALRIRPADGGPEQRVASGEVDAN